MRKSLLLILSVSVFASCTRRTCWECDVVTAQGLSYKESICNRTKKEIEQLQAEPKITKDKTGKVIFITTYANCVSR